MYAMCESGCEHAKLGVHVFYALYINFRSFSQSVIQRELLEEKMITSYGSKLMQLLLWVGEQLSVIAKMGKSTTMPIALNYCRHCCGWGKIVSHRAKMVERMTMPSALN